MAAFFFAAVLVQYPIGRLSDRIGRRPIQLGGLVTYAVASIAFALIGTPLAALVVRAPARCRRRCRRRGEQRHRRRDRSRRRQQGRAYGALFGSRTVGLAIGPFIGGVVGISAMRWLFVAAALASLLALRADAARRAEGARRPRRIVVELRRSSCGGTGACSASAFGYAGAGVVIGVYEVCWSLLLAPAGRLGLADRAFLDVVRRALRRHVAPGRLARRSLRPSLPGGRVDARLGGFCRASTRSSTRCGCSSVLGSAEAVAGRDRRAGARRSARPQRPEPPARASPGRRFDGPDRHDRGGAVCARGAVRGCIPGCRSSGRRARSWCSSPCSPGAGGAFLGGTGARADRRRAARGGGDRRRPAARARPGRCPSVDAAQVVTG